MSVELNKNWVLARLQVNLDSFGSELGMGLSLFSLVVSTRATHVLEFGRFKGYSAMAMASGLDFLNSAPWAEPQKHKQRPIDYQDHEAVKPRMLVSVDPAPRAEAEEILKEYGLTDFVTFVNKKSDQYEPPAGISFDIVLIDGDHTEDQTYKDFARSIFWVKPGGYIVIHDYYGYYGADAGEKQGQLEANPVRRAIERIKIDYRLHIDHVVIDTGYMSFWLARTKQEPDE